jgi:hypothetical protein
LYLLWIDDEPLTTNQRESWKLILKSAHRAADLVRNLQSLSGSRAPVDEDLRFAENCRSYHLACSSNRNTIIKDVDIPDDTFFIHGNESDIYIIR